MKVSNSVLEELIVKHKGFVTQICKAAGIELIREKHYPSIRFYLETQGKSKGYVVRQEVDQNTTVKSILEVPELEAYEPTIDDIREH